MTEVSIEQWLRNEAAQSMAMSRRYRLESTARTLHEDRAKLFTAAAEKAAELEKWRENVEALLADDRDVVRCREGGGPEDLIGSLVLTLSRTRRTRDEHAPQPFTLHVVFKDEGGPMNLRFVEVETPDGKSVDAGTWAERNDGYRALVLSVHPSDIRTVEVREDRNELDALLKQAKERYDALTPEEKREHDEARKASQVRGMTARCEHGEVDFEQCPKCRAKASMDGVANAAIQDLEARARRLRQHIAELRLDYPEAAHARSEELAAVETEIGILRGREVSR